MNQELSPQQELFSALRVELEKTLPGRVYDGQMPPEGTEYPFVFLGNTTEKEGFYIKGAFFGVATIAVHVWTNNVRARGDLSSVLFAIRRLGHKVEETKNYGWCVSGADEDIVPDNTTSEPLMHGIVNLEYKYWRI